MLYTYNRLEIWSGGGFNVLADIGMALYYFEGNSAKSASL